jgi:hypothetical protein
MAQLFNKGRTTITEHIQNVFKEGELEENSACRNFRHTANDGKNYNTNYFNLDVIDSVGYRVKSQQDIRIGACRESIHHLPRTSGRGLPAHPRSYPGFSPKQTG